MNFDRPPLIIAVDFDGTICEDGYPGIGKPHIFAFETLKRMQIPLLIFMVFNVNHLITSDCYSVFLNVSFTLFLYKFEILERDRNVKTKKMNRRYKHKNIKVIN